MYNSVTSKEWRFKTQRTHCSGCINAIRASVSRSELCRTQLYVFVFSAGSPDVRGTVTNENCPEEDKYKGEGVWKPCFMRNSQRK